MRLVLHARENTGRKTVFLPVFLYNQGNCVKSSYGEHRETIPDQAVRRWERALPAALLGFAEIRRQVSLRSLTALFFDRFAMGGDVRGLAPKTLPEGQ